MVLMRNSIYAGPQMSDLGDTENKQQQQQKMYAGHRKINKHAGTFRHFYAKYECLFSWRQRIVCFFHWNFYCTRFILFHFFLSFCACAISTYSIKKTHNSHLPPFQLPNSCIPQWPWRAFSILHKNHKQQWCIQPNGFSVCQTTFPGKPSTQIVFSKLIKRLFEQQQEKSSRQFSLLLLRLLLLTSWKKT